MLLNNSTLNAIRYLTALLGSFLRETKINLMLLLIAMSDALHPYKKWGNYLYAVHCTVLIRAKGEKKAHFYAPFLHTSERQSSII